MVKTEFITAAGTRHSGVISVPLKASAVVVMSHGFSSSKDSAIYKEMEAEFNERGIGTFRYDCFGHGESSGNFEDITLGKAFCSLYWAIQHVKSKKDYDIGLFGASFGGLVSLMAASLRKDVRALALKSPVTDPISFWQDRLEEERIKEWEQEGVLHYDCHGEKYDLNYGFWQDLHTHDLDRMIQSLACTTFIVHGSADTVVPISQSRMLAKKIGSESSLRVIQGADHAYSKPEHYEQVKRIMVDFLAAELRQQC